MNKALNKAEGVITDEIFELRLITKLESMDVISLIKLLNQTNDMFQSINETLNAKYNSGYLEVDVEVFAVEKGSIRIPLRIRKFANKNLWPLVTTIIGGVAVNLISGNRETIIIASPSGDVESASSVFLDNLSTKRSVGNIAQLVVENDSITDLSVTYQKNNGEQETVTVTKNTLKKVAEDCDETYSPLINLHTKQRLKIYGPVLENKPSSWRVRLNGEPIHAYMRDCDFLQEMTAKKIAFAPDDEIIADLEEVITEDEKGLHRKWTILKVHSYPKYTRILRNNNETPALL